MSRIATVHRKTGETNISVTINLDGSGKADIATGIGFLDHMLNAFARHGFFDLSVKVKGDYEVDGHHSVEDTGIVIGQAIAKAVGDKKGIKRYGSCTLPMDETLSMCAVDLCGRPYFVSDACFTAPMVGDFDTQLVEEFFYALSYSAMINLHFKLFSGQNDHHKIEAMFKSFAKAMDEATQFDTRITEVLSTKGSLGESIDSEIDCNEEYSKKPLKTDYKWSDFKLGPDNLVPVVVQDYLSNQVLMVAYMNEEAFNTTIATGKMTYYSRSRKELWIKGNTSGHFQYVQDLVADCDKDTILAKVKQIGAACHTGSYSCFFNSIAKIDL
nr:imidazoleglycerol-phosphate dehydratase HisB [Butyrivibrio sp. NC3005]